MTIDASIGAYLEQIEAGLAPVPPRARREALAELRSGLLDAADAQRAAGLSTADATRAAIAEFGNPRRIAAALRAELILSHARRFAVVLLFSGPLTGLFWLLAALGSRFGFRLAAPWQWTGFAPSAQLAAHLCAAALLLAAVTMTLTLTATRSPSGWIAEHPGLVSMATAISGLEIVAADLAILALLASQLLDAPARLDPLPVFLAAAASLIRLTLTSRTAQGFLRAALPAH